MNVILGRHMQHFIFKSRLFQISLQRLFFYGGRKIFTPTYIAPNDFILSLILKSFKAFFLFRTYLNVNLCLLGNLLACKALLLYFSLCSWMFLCLAYQFQVCFHHLHTFLPLTSKLFLHYRYFIMNISFFVLF